MASSLLVGGGSVLALLLFGPDDSFESEIIVVVGAIVAAYVLRPAVELSWHFLWVPWRQVKDDIADIREALDSPAVAESEPKKRRVVKVRLTLMKLVDEGRDIAARYVGMWSTTAHEARGWSDSVTEILNKYVGDERVEEFLQAGQGSTGVEQFRARVDWLEQFVPEAPEQATKED